MNQATLENLSVGFFGETSVNQDRLRQVMTVCHNLIAAF
jgi:hypothetical protein